MKANRVMITGTGSGCGKTTVTCALLSALKARKLHIAGFKCGPDYIDPMFHSEIIGTGSANLDLFLCDENTVKYLLAEGLRDACDARDPETVKNTFAVIEGVMGMYDGIGFTDDRCSANHIARITETPEILVVSVRGKSVSLLAELTGYLRFGPNCIKGVILNHCSPGMYSAYKNMIESSLELKVYGYLPKIKEAELGSRHLGLVTAEEVEDLKSKIAALGKTAAETLDLDGILKLAEEAPELTFEEISVHPVCGPEAKDAQARPRIAVARDKAFCFYYRDNFKLLQKLGAELVFFSPLKDNRLPEKISGLILGGGYPEEYLEMLSENKRLLSQIRESYRSGMPIYAECGGFMYLGESIEKEGKIYPMVGAIHGNFHMTKGLVRFGYKKLTANKDNLMCRAGESISCHEFHYSDTDCYGNAFTASKANGKTWQTIQAEESLFAGYPHLHLWSNIRFAENFVTRCAAWAKRRDEAAKGGEAWN